MQIPHLLALGLAGLTAAQQSTPSLTDALASQNSSLSSLITLLGTQPDLVRALGSLTNITILAPNNDALARFLNSSSSVPPADAVTALLSYHVLNGTYYASNITSTPAFVPTLLTNETYANVTGGQVVEAMAMNNSVLFYSGLGENSTVVTPNLNFTGGTIHIIDRVLTIPEDIVDTSLAGGLIALAGALNQTNLVGNLTSAKDVTVFAPNNAAFASIANLLSNLTTEQIVNVLGYHVVAGTVDYSTRIQNGTVKALNGEDLTLRVINGSVFVNSAKVIQPNVLVSNGVVHVIDNILNPMNATATPDPTASNQGPAFTGASSASNIPYTSGQMMPTTTAPLATGARATSTSTGLGVPMKTGAMGAAALFGGAAILVNL